MKDILLKILTITLYIIGCPVIILVLGIFMWFISLLDYIND